MPISADREEKRAGCWYDDLWPVASHTGDAAMLRRRKRTAELLAYADKPA
jgi:hypothetical protein